MISDEYKKLLQTMHVTKFLSGTVKYEIIHEFVREYRPYNILDFGCAKGDLINELRKNFPRIQPIDGYDPAVEEFSTPPSRVYDCLISNDVIEHIEPEFLKDTLRYMESLFNRYAWFIIACYPAKKNLPDGRNAHLIVEQPSWWLNILENTLTDSRIIYQEVTEFTEGKPELRIILRKS